MPFEAVLHRPSDLLSSVLEDILGLRLGRLRPLSSPGVRRGGMLRRNRYQNYGK